MWDNKEPRLTLFVCLKVSDHTPPEDIEPQIQNHQLDAKYSRYAAQCAPLVQLQPGPFNKKVTEAKVVPAADISVEDGKAQLFLFPKHGPAVQTLSLTSKPGNYFCTDQWSIPDMETTLFNAPFRLLKPTVLSV